MSKPESRHQVEAAVEERTFLSEYFDRYRRSLFDETVTASLIDLKNVMKDASTSGNKTIMAGNGGSAATAAHCVVDFTKNAGVRCINFNDAQLVTCLANDYGYERWVEKGLELYADDGDVILLISSSGQSPNMVRAADYTREHGHQLVTFTGFAADNPLKLRGGLNFWVDSRAYNIVEMTHHIWLLSVCDLIIGAAEYPAS